jgi:muramidase (phage lysozyme)
MGAAVGDEIVAANAVGPISANTVIAHLVHWTGLIDGIGYPNLADAAVAQLVPGIEPGSLPPTLVGLAFASSRPVAGASLVVLAPSAARGVVRNSSGSFPVAWQDMTTSRIWDYGMADQVLGAFALTKGDSGAAVVDATGQLVGTVVGQPALNTEDAATTTVISPIDTIAGHRQWHGRRLIPFRVIIPGVPVPGPGLATTPSISEAAASLSREARALLTALAGGEASGWNELCGGGTFHDYSKFPDWPGRPGPAGISHSAGYFQFQPGTWKDVAGRHGLTDFSPRSQALGAWAYAQEVYGPGLQAALEADNVSRVAAKLHGVWLGGADAGFAARYRAAI